MHNLRAYLGDDVFRNAVQNVIAERFDSHMDVADFEQLLENATGEDLTPFFEAQALQPGFSTWVMDSITTGPDNGCFATTLHLQQKLRACSTTTKTNPWTSPCGTPIGTPPWCMRGSEGNTIKSRFGTKTRLSWSASMQTVA